MSPLVAGLAAGLAAWLAVPDRGGVVAARLGGGGATRGGPARGDPGPPAGLARLAAVAVGMVAVVVGGPVPALIAAALAAGVPRLVRHRRAAREAAATRAALPLVCRAVAAELRAGATPADALAGAADVAPPALGRRLREVAAAAGLGMDPAAMLADAVPGGGDLALVAACWRVTAATGAGLADVTSRLADALAAEEGIRREVAANLAGPRASAAVLAGLPVVGVALGTALGADPLGFYATPLGGVCLAAGVALDTVGWAWTTRLARGVLR